jgi:hypothetical protein
MEFIWNILFSFVELKIDLPSASNLLLNSYIRNIPFMKPTNPIFVPEQLSALGTFLKNMNHLSTAETSKDVP